MKILKAFLLTFVILFTVNTVNAQCDELSMTVVPITSSVFDVTVEHSTPQHLVIFIDGYDGDDDTTFVSQQPVNDMNAKVVFSPLVHPPGKYIIRCGLKERKGINECYEGCTVTVDY